jgi:SAM-dependent methyltransferase
MPAAIGVARDFSLTDQSRWNARYAAQPAVATPPPRDWLVVHAALLPAPGFALDLAMGLGGSSGWLVERGWRVVGVDVSEVAVRRAKARWPALCAVVADLARFPLPSGVFDLILDFYYLDRGLWPQVRRALRPGGLFVMETFVQPSSGSPPINPAYLLAPGELRAAFRDWEMLAAQEDGYSAAIVAQRRL